MSEDRKVPSEEQGTVPKAKEEGVVLGNKDEQHFNLDKDHNEGEMGAVVFKDGRPILVGASTNPAPPVAPSNLEKEKENETREVDAMLAKNRTVRVTALPDDLGEGGLQEEQVLEEKLASDSSPLEGKNKPVTRLKDASAEPAPVKKKRGRPKKKG
jgi:hypothetical protein